MALEILRDIQLKKFNTFGVSAKAAEFVRITDMDQLVELREYLSHHPEKPFMVLGGGSDVLFRQDYEGLIVLMEMRGVEFADENEDYYFVRAFAGETWHTFVRRTIDAGRLGLENLALIPGTVGAAPIQNIGAYGLEVAERIASLHCYDLERGEIVEFSAEECEFGYRTSIFKKPENRKYIITSVLFKLPKVWTPLIEYGDLKREIDAYHPPRLIVEDVFASVVALRSRKLPNPQRLGNAGSFFKNPVLTQEAFEALKKRAPDVAHYPLEDGTVKVSAAWLIDNAGLKGIRMGDVGTYERQPLVIVNYGRANGEEVYAMAQDVRRHVKNCFGITLHPEVVIV